MAKKSRAKKAAPTTKAPFRPIRWVTRWTFRLATALAVLGLGLVLLWGSVNPPTTFYMMQEKRRLGDLDHAWVSMDEIAPVMARSVVAAEDANFCLHWGFDVTAIRSAIEDGRGRGASTLSQQVVKNVFLWHGRTWVRKALEAVLTPVVEAVWSKQRILEVYLNVAEFDEGVFGVEAAARHYFRVGPEALSARQAARLAAVLPAPKSRSAAKPTDFIRKRSASIADGAATIRADGRADCFQS
ncbi:MAG: monofunctional biosynthetic peptidoglycan transglycosylase [Paracoccaceae bacterium]